LAGVETGATDLDLRRAGALVDLTAMLGLLVDILNFTPFERVAGGSKPQQDGWRIS